MNNYVFWGAILTSYLISLAYLGVALLKKDSTRIIKSVILLLCPIIGLVYCFGAKFVAALLLSKHRMRLDEIGFSKERRPRIPLPDIDKETQTIPLEESFVASTRHNKRRYLLSHLKKENTTSFLALKKAIEDSDTETAHYAASAILGAKANFDNNIRILGDSYEQNKWSIRAFREYTEMIINYIRSGLISGFEVSKYRSLYIYAITNTLFPESVLNDDDYTRVAKEATALQEYSLAEAWAKRAVARFKTENAYLSLAQVYYCTVQKEKMLQTLDALKESNVPLSSEGISLIRFFNIRL